MLTTVQEVECAVLEDRESRRLAKKIYPQVLAKCLSHRTEHPFDKLNDADLRQVASQVARDTAVQILEAIGEVFGVGEKQ